MRSRSFHFFGSMAVNAMLRPITPETRQWGTRTLSRREPESGTSTTSVRRTSASWRFRMLTHPPDAVGAIDTTCARHGGGANGNAAAIAIRRTAFRVSVRISSGSVPTSGFLDSAWPFYPLTMEGGTICETGETSETGENAVVTEFQCCSTEGRRPASEQIDPSPVSRVSAVSPFFPLSLQKWEFEARQNSLLTRNWRKLRRYGSRFASSMR